ncbi:MAG: hypothetical protein NVS9B1_01250 [Candidatus Dormibacteraceae bacterium]
MGAAGGAAVAAAVTVALRATPALVCACRPQAAVRGRRNPTTSSPRGLVRRRRRTPALTPRERTGTIRTTMETTNPVKPKAFAWSVKRVRAMTKRLGREP